MGHEGWLKLQDSVDGGRGIDLNDVLDDIMENKVLTLIYSNTREVSFCFSLN